MSTPAETSVRARRVWDLVLTIVLLVLYLLITAFGSFTSIFLAFTGDSCNASTVCDYDQIGNAVIIVLAGVWVPSLFVIGASIILLVKRRIAFWVPLVGIVLTIAIVVTGFAVASWAVRPL